MNKTEANLTTVDPSLVAFLLWKHEIPTRIDFTNGSPLFVYYGNTDYCKLLRSYWEGDYIPACEMGQCYSLVRRMTDGVSLPNYDDIREEIEHLQDYREMYCHEITIGELADIDSDIIKRLEAIESL